MEHTWKCLIWLCSGPFTSCSACSLDQSKQQTFTQGASEKAEETQMKVKLKIIVNLREKTSKCFSIFWQSEERVSVTTKVKENEASFNSFQKTEGKDNEIN